MWFTFFLAPYIISLFIAVFHPFVLMYQFFMLNTPIDTQKKPPEIVVLFSKLFRLIYFGIGILLLDIVICWLTGQWGYGDWRFQLPSLLLGLIVGSQYIIQVLFTKPKRSTFIASVIFIVGVIYFLHFYMPLQQHLRASLVNLVYVFVITIAFLLIVYLYQHKTKHEEEILWDKSKEIDRILNVKWNFCILIISLIQAILTFAGTSMFIW